MRVAGSKLSYSSSCFFCGDDTKDSNTKVTKSAGGLNDNQNGSSAEILIAWKEECILSTCRSLKIPRSHPAVGELLSSTSTKFCGGCVTLMRDLDFSLRAMDRLQRNITKLHRTLLDKLEWKDETTSDKKNGRKSTGRSGNDEPFDLFEFVLMKAKEVRDEDTFVPLPAETTMKVDSNKLNKPLGKATVEEVTKPLPVFEVSTHVKEEMDCEDEDSADFDCDDFSLFPSVAEEDESGEYQESTKKVLKEESTRELQSNCPKETPRRRAKIKKLAATIGESEDSDSEVEPGKAFSKMKSGNSSDEDFMIPACDLGESDNMSGSDDGDYEWIVEPEKPAKKSLKSKKRKSEEDSGEIKTPTKRRKRKNSPSLASIACPYSCCEEMVKTFNALDTHIKRIHRENLEKFFSCEFCDKKFAYNTNVKMHCRDVHRNEYSNDGSNSNIKSPCSFCGVSQNPEELEEHENLHRSREFPFSCLICDTKLTKAPALSRHMKRTHPPNNQNMKQCHHCGAWFNTEATLRSHLFRLHQEGSEQMFPCDFCSKIFTTPKAKEDHTKTCFKAPDNKFKSVCDKCGKVLMNKYQLAVHVLTHEEPQFKCLLCDKAFHRKTTLVKHQELHAGLQFPCPDCDMVFNAERYLKTHSKRHAPRVLRRYRIDKAKRGLCPEGDNCTKRCKMIHLGFQFRCDLCPKTFRTDFQLKYHGKSHLPDELKRHRRKTDKKADDSLSSGSSDCEDEEEAIMYSAETLQSSLVQ